MRLTGHEIMLIAVLVAALTIGALTKCYRNSHAPGNPLPAGVPGQSSGEP